MEISIARKFGLVLKAARAEVGLSQQSLALEVVLPFIRDAQDQVGNCNDYEGYISTPPAEGYNVEMNPFYCDDRLFECCIAPS